VTYGTTAPGVATVGQTSGLITAVAPGSATITITASNAQAGAFGAASVTATAVVTVTALPSGLASIAVTPSAVNLGTGKTTQIVATASQPNGAPAASYTYATSAQSVATVSASGLITAVAPGSAVITVTGATAANADFAAGSATATIPVTVAALPSGISSVNVAPSSVSLVQGRTAQLRATVAQPTGAAEAQVSFGTNAPAIANVDAATGMITAVAPGSAVITVTATSAANGDFAAATQTALVPVTVTAPEAGISAVSVSPSNVSILPGATSRITASVVQPQGAPAAMLSYTSNTEAVATVSEAGLITAVAPGTAVITVTATSSAATGFAAATRTGLVQVTVTAPQSGITSVSVAPSNVTLRVGGTSQLSASAVQPNGAPAVSYSYGTNAPSVVSVDQASGLITALQPGAAVVTVTASTNAALGFAATSQTALVQVTVSALEPGVTSVAVTPTAINLAVGGTVTAVASVTQPTGAPAATVAYSSNAAAVASVDPSTGVITAVAPGTAIITATATSPAAGGFAAGTQSAQVQVTVAQLPQVTIANITQGTTTNPVNINSVSGQIQTQLNLATNGNNVRAVRLYVCDVAVAAATCAAGNAAAEQTFGANGAASGDLNMFINTADFTVAGDFSTASARYTNGQKNLVAQIETQASGLANNTLAILNFNNADGWVARHVAPTRSVTVNNTVVFGGPGNDGRASVTIAPVIYTASRSIASATVTISGCSATATFAAADARPWTMTYGASAVDAKNVACAYQTLLNAAPDVQPTITSIDNANATGPAAASLAAYLTNTSSTPAVAAPAAIRGDWVAPVGAAYTLNAATNATAGWVNNSYNFAAAGNLAGSDAGVGLDAAQYLYETRGCGSTTWTAMTTKTGADLNECATDFNNNVYTLRFTSVDRLGNAAAAVAANIAFGVDKTAPTIALNAPTDTTGKVYSTATQTTAGWATTIAPSAATLADTVYASRALDERAGLNFAQYAFNEAGACATGGTIVAATAQTAPGCSFSSTGVAFAGAAWTDGTRLIETPEMLYTQIGAADGYAGYQTRVYDRAGNVATAPFRSVLKLMNAVTTVTADLPLFTLNSTSTQQFAGSYSGALEGRVSSWRITYTAGANTSTFVFPGTLASNSTFDDNLLSTGTLTGGFPASWQGTRFYTQIERTNAGVIDGATVLPATSFAFAAGNFGSAASTVSAAQNIISGTLTLDTQTWTQKLTAASSAMTSFNVVGSVASNNAPAGGLKAQVVGPSAVTTTPVDRIDFYVQNGADTWEYIGTTGTILTSQVCTSPIAGCSAYVSDDGTNRVWTYVLRDLGTTPTGIARTATILTATPTIKAIAVRGTGGRVLSTNGTIAYTAN
jgi:uncharacterized protein YjdB